MKSKGPSYNSRKITEVKQLMPQLAHGGDHSRVEVDTVVNNTVASQERRNGPPIHAHGAKKIFILNLSRSLFSEIKRLYKASNLRRPKVHVP